MLAGQVSESASRASQEGRFPCAGTAPRSTMYLSRSYRQVCAVVGLLYCKFKFSVPHWETFSCPPLVIRTVHVNLSVCSYYPPISDDSLINTIVAETPASSTCFETMASSHDRHRRWPRATECNWQICRLVVGPSPMFLRRRGVQKRAGSGTVSRVLHSLLKRPARP